MFNIDGLNSKSTEEIEKICEDLRIKVKKNATDTDKIYAILDFQGVNTKIVEDYIKKNELTIEKIPADKPKKQKTKTVTKEAKSEKTPQQIEKTEKNKKNKTKKTKKESLTDDVVVEKTKKETPKEETSIVVEVQTSNNEAKNNQQQTTKKTKRQRIQPKQEETLIAEKEITIEKKVKEPQPQDTKKTQQKNKKKQNQNKVENTSQQETETTTNEVSANETPIQPTKKEYNFDGLVTIEGVLEILPDNYGFLRSSDFSYISSPDDVYVSTAQIRTFGLKTGDTVKGVVRLPKEGEKYFSLLRPIEVNGRDLSFIKDRVGFEYLTPIFPNEKFNLSGNNATTSTKIIDLFAPIGKGQRAMLVAQPKTGKTTLLKDIANAISQNHPESYMIVLLIDERPEEVTDMERSVNAEVIASTFDESAEKHVKVANIVLAKAQRMVECGHDVVILLDSITRLARAYNTVTPASGKILSGGVDANALHRPKRFFGAARNIENGGSLTIIATALIDTGSKMDDVIFEEFKGTGNMELQLDRRISNKRIYPAIDLVNSGTRRDDLLLPEHVYNKINLLRTTLADMNITEAIKIISSKIEECETQEEFLEEINK
jgi:transcription termination factor rho